MSGQFDATMAMTAGLPADTPVLRKPFPLMDLLRLMQATGSPRLKPSPWAPIRGAQALKPLHATAAFVSRQPMLDLKAGCSVRAPAPRPRTEPDARAPAPGADRRRPGPGPRNADPGQAGLPELQPRSAGERRRNPAAAPRNAVIQLRRGVEVDDEVVSACQALHTAGYRLALDFVSDPEGERLLPFMKFVKIDVRSMSLGARRRRCQAARIAATCARLPRRWKRPRRTRARRPRVHAVPGLLLLSAHHAEDLGAAGPPAGLPAAATRRCASRTWASSDRGTGQARRLAQLPRPQVRQLRGLRAPLRSDVDQAGPHHDRRRADPEAGCRCGRWPA